MCVSVCVRAWLWVANIKSGMQLWDMPRAAWLARVSKEQTLRKNTLKARPWAANTHTHTCTGCQSDVLALFYIFIFYLACKLETLSHTLNNYTNCSCCHRALTSVEQHFALPPTANMPTRTSQRACRSFSRADNALPTSRSASHIYRCTPYTEHATTCDSVASYCRLPMLAACFFVFTNPLFMLSIPPLPSYV